MAVQFKDGVVIGADSRTTTGSYIVRATALTEKFASRLILRDRPIV